MSRGGKRQGAGRKKGSATTVRLPEVKAEIKHELRELAREHTGAALEALVRICKMGDSESARVSAANALLDRGYGKPLQQIESGGPGEFGRMSDEELDAFLAEGEPAKANGKGNGKAHH